MTIRFAAVCDGDSPYAGFTNPKIAMQLQGTIMEGKSHCILRYHYLYPAENRTPRRENKEDGLSRSVLSG